MTPPKYSASVRQECRQVRFWGVPKAGDSITNTDVQLERRSVKYRGLARSIARIDPYSKARAGTSG